MWNQGRRTLLFLSLVLFVDGGDPAFVLVSLPDPLGVVDAAHGCAIM
jgi:hypothetical protein